MMPSAGAKGVGIALLVGSLLLLLLPDTVFGQQREQRPANLHYPVDLVLSNSESSCSAVGVLVGSIFQIDSESLELRLSPTQNDRITCGTASLVFSGEAVRVRLSRLDQESGATVAGELGLGPARVWRWTVVPPGANPAVTGIAYQDSTDPTRMRFDSPLLTEGSLEEWTLYVDGPDWLELTRPPPVRQSSEEYRHSQVRYVLSYCSGPAVRRDDGRCDSAGNLHSSQVREAAVGDRASAVALFPTGDLVGPRYQPGEGRELQLDLVRRPEARASSGPGPVLWQVEVLLPEVGFWRGTGLESQDGFWTLELEAVQEPDHGTSPRFLTLHRLGPPVTPADVPAARLDWEALWAGIPENPRVVPSHAFLMASINGTAYVRALGCVDVLKDLVRGHEVVGGSFEADLALLHFLESAAPDCLTLESSIGPVPSALPSLGKRYR